MKIIVFVCLLLLYKIMNLLFLVIFIVDRYRGIFVPIKCPAKIILCPFPYY